MTRTLTQPLAAETARHSRHFQLIVDIHLLLVANGDLLLGRRANTGYGDGAYEPPSGRLAERETLVEAAVRVAAAQMGIALDPARVSLAHVLHDVSGAGRMAFFLTADGWADEACQVPPASRGRELQRLRLVPAHRPAGEHDRPCPGRGPQLRGGRPLLHVPRLRHVADSRPKIKARVSERSAGSAWLRPSLPAVTEVPGR